MTYLATGRVSPLGAFLQFTGALGSYLIAYFLGWYLGASVWPRHGGTVARKLLESYAKNPERGELVMTGRPEFHRTAARRIWEASALMASLSVLYVLVTRYFVALPGTLAGSVLALVAIAYLSIFLVPHWSFARLGLRRVDRARFIVQPLTRDYSDRLKLSNGALVVLVLGAGGFILRQKGATDAEAMTQMVALALITIPFILLLAASAVAHYQRRERVVLDSLARDAVRLGYRDARGENEADIFRSARPSADAPR